MFVAEYLSCNASGQLELNATRAYRAAYPGCKTDNAAAVTASKLLRNPKIQAAIQEFLQERQNRLGITPDRVLKEYARLGFFDPRKLFNNDGSPKGIEELDDDSAAVLAGMEVMEVYEGYGEDRKFVGYLKKYKLANKLGALDSIGKHLGMFIDKHEITGKNGAPIQVQAVQALTDEELEAKIAAEIATRMLKE
jgi:phage terminase small subunit